MKKKLTRLLTGTLLTITFTQAQSYYSYNSDTAPVPSQKESKEFCNI